MPSEARSSATANPWGQVPEQPVMLGAGQSNKEGTGLVLAPQPSRTNADSGGDEEFQPTSISCA
jgi:hypothetical protein